MIKKFLAALLFVGLSACSSADTSDDTTIVAYDPELAYDLTDVSYGTDPEQTMDVYLPAKRNKNTKVVVLVHGGAWVSGSKEDFNNFIPVIKTRFPQHAIVNINYRLATTASPAFPKQVEDLQQVIAFLKDSDYTIANNYAFIGASAGAHLALLYGYKYDTAHEVKAIGNVGPADFLDPAYTSHPLYNYAAQNLLGTANITQQMITEVSPLAHITAQAAKNGDSEPLTPG